MKQKQTLRATLFALSASIVLPTAPVFGQETAPPVVAPPSPVTTTTAPPPRIVVTPPAAQQPAPTPAPRVTLPPVPEVQAPADAPEARRAATRTTRAAPRARAAAPRATSAPVAEAVAPAPTAELPPTTVEPVPPVAPVSALSPATGATGEAAEPAAGPSLFWLIAGLAGLALIALITFLALRRRRTDEEVYYEEPALVEEPAPVAVEPVAPAPEPDDYQEPLIAPAPTFAREPAQEPAPAPVREVAAPTVSAADETDVAALAASSDAGGERPWLEFLLRPVRAGTSRDETIVQYDLTIANTGGRDAHDVRVTSWLFPAGTSEMEQSLIDGPAEARAAEADIAAGEGVRIVGEASLAKAGLSDETVLPVLVAEARYRLPDGREGRTRAAFEIGMSADGHIAPFPIDRATGLVEFVEARLHGEPERV